MEPQTVTQIGIIAPLAGVASLLAKMLWDQLQKRRAAADPDRESDAAAKTFGTALRSLTEKVESTGKIVYEVRGMMQTYTTDMALVKYRLDQLEKKVEALR